MAYVVYLVAARSAALFAVGSNAGCCHATSKSLPTAAPLHSDCPWEGTFLCFLTSWGDGKIPRVNTQSSCVNRVPRSLLERPKERDRIINLCDIHENNISSWEGLDSSTWIFCITLAHREHVVTSGKMVTTWNVKVAYVALSDTCCFHNSYVSLPWDVINDCRQDGWMWCGERQLVWQGNFGFSILSSSPCRFVSHCNQRHSYFSSTSAFCLFPTYLSLNRVWAPFGEISGCIVSEKVHLSCNLDSLCSVLTHNLSPTILCSTESFIRGVADSCRASSFSSGSCFCGPQFLKMSLNGRHAPLILVVFDCFFVLHLGLRFLLSWINLDYFWKLFDFSPWMILQVQPAGQYAAVSYIKMFALTWGHLSHKICFVCLALNIQICISLQHDYQIEVYFLCGCSHSVADFTRLWRCFFWLLGGIAWWADCGLWTVADNDGSWQLQQHSCHFDY